MTSYINVDQILQSEFINKEKEIKELIDDLF